MKKLVVKIWWSLLFIVYINFNSCSNDDSEYLGVVSGGSPEAVDAGIAILKQNGNAVDAAIAITFALAVSEPAQSGLGGQAQFLIYNHEADPIIINGTSFSPSRLPPNVIKDDLIKHRATTVPSVVKVLGYLWENYSSDSIKWEKLLVPAINFADQGFSNTEFRHKILEYKVNELRNDSVVNKLFLGTNNLLGENEILWKQPVLARTLKQLAQRGASDFYTGDIAHRIAEDMKNNNGWITIDDLNNFPAPREQKPLKGSYRGFEIFTMPPPGGGWVIIQALNILEQFSSEDLTLESKNRLKFIVQALQLAHQNRKHEPIKDLTEFHKDVMQKISKEKAKLMLNNSSIGETTHFSVVDKRGMVVSATLSINNYYGSKSASPSLGFLYNDYMNEFKINEPGHPFNLRPNAMPYSSMTPTILMKDGKPVLALGSPGSERIISAIVQVISLWIDAGLNIKDAISFPRIHVTPDSVIYIESNDLFKEEIYKLQKSGFTFGVPPSSIIINNLNPYFGGVHAVALEKNKWIGAADTRRDGKAGYVTH
jgi:gamma-glutamyltranspeptidase/glutathione hydrolase